MRIQSVFQVETKGKEEYTGCICEGIGQIGCFYMESEESEMQGMETQVRKVDGEGPKAAYDEATKILHMGGLVAFPTETVYGLGGNALDEHAAKRIYAAKGRPSDNPLIVHIADMQALEDLTKEVPDVARRLAEAFWPGPLTMILPKSENVPLGTTGGLSTVAVRMPDHPVALSLIRQSGLYLAAPSANTSGRPSPTLAEHVYEDLRDKIDLILDGGMVKVGIESTIVDLTEEIPMILRPGCITKEMLETVVGKVRTDPAILCEAGVSVDKPKAPGMKYKHYAPKADMTIYSGAKEKVVARIVQEAQRAFSEGMKVGIVATDETISCYQVGEVRSIGSRGEAGSIARGLYKILRDFDHLQVDIILAESFEDDPMGAAIMNRMKKAAGYAVVRVE